ncbi:thiamine-monophosphate kinase [Duganella sp. BuS-21]|uniref:thiamine-phosphate kinase n=1 Tax=Duganella sp. BuS-21 TaxID=2943848 RepID=UPI0035A5C6A5
MVTMSDLGEKAFLKALLPELHVAPMFVNGFGHDASIVDVGLEQCLAVKIDRAAFPVALKHGIGDYRTWGRLAVAANVSDLLAVGAVPRALMLSLVVPGTFEASDARAIVKGCEEACAWHDIAFVGGDTKEGDAAQVIGSAWGTVEKKFAFGRAAAKPGDRLFIAGRLGAFAGVLALLELVSAQEQNVPDEWQEILTIPMARLHEGKYLRKSRMVAAACDLSDGLADALHIFCADGAGITIAETSLPLHQLASEASVKTGVPLWRFAFGVGDWSIALVVHDQDVKAFKRAITGKLELFEIGQFNNTGRKIIRDACGADIEVPDLINEQFRRRLEDNGSYLKDLMYRS